ncbi:ganglioside GM2 activator-like [Limulus polyphemus]|uniref:Ganglioside GM2 activator-like n=1 Tax=Limulus polyphemus TaxID=6850 RepID=A0ABM1B772_LIMPO|nr:ganglioside GM2 activator-like [Limulus polyphemus]
MSGHFVPVVLMVMVVGLGVVKPAHAEATDTWTGYIQDQALRFAYHLSSHSVEKRDTDRQGKAKLAFEHCGEDDDPVYVNNFVIEPNPVVVPGPIGVGMTLDVRENQTAPLPVKLTMSKKLSLLFGLAVWLPIPCLPNDVGSCTYKDLCKTRLFTEGECLDPVTNDTISCGCPFEKGEYRLLPVVFNISRLPSSMPKYLLEGEFYVKAELIKDGKHLACYSTTITLEL